MWFMRSANPAAPCFCVYVFYIHMKRWRKCGSNACRDLCLWTWALWKRMVDLCNEAAEVCEVVSAYAQVQQDTHTCCPDAGSFSARCFGIKDRLVSYLRGTTKTPSCCWLHTEPAESWESAEPLYSPDTAGRTPLLFTPNQTHSSLPEIRPWKVVQWWNLSYMGYSCCIMNHKTIPFHCFILN